MAVTVCVVVMAVIAGRPVGAAARGGMGVMMGHEAAR